MADRNYDRSEERNRWRRDEDERNEGGYGYRERDRGFLERAGDEVASWFGDEEADRRRRMDEREGRFEDDRDDNWYGTERRYTSPSTRGAAGQEWGSYRPDYDNDERDRYATGGYGRGRGTDVDYSSRSAGGYQGSEQDRQSSYYGAGSERDYRRQSGQADRGGFGGYEQRAYGRYGRGEEQGYGETWGTGREGGYGYQDFRREGGYDRSRWESRGEQGRARAQQSGYSGQGYGIEIRDNQSRMRSGTARGLERGGERWREQGPHVGKGPKGYQRSEQSIREDVCERLMQHGEIDASDIDVKIQNGEVTLEGTVDSWNTKRMAEDIIENVPGVRDVMNHLRVSQSGQQGRQQGIGTRSGTVGTTGTTPGPSGAAGGTGEPIQAGQTGQGGQTPQSGQPARGTQGRSGGQGGSKQSS